MKPMPSPRVALRLSCPSPTPSASRSRAWICGRCGSSFGCSITTVASTCSIVQPRSPSIATRGPQQLERVGAAVALVGVGEVLADVTERGGAEQRVDDRVRQHVGIGMTEQPVRVRDLDAADDQRPALDQLVAVVAEAGGDAHDPLRSVDARGRDSSARSRSSSSARRRSSGVVILKFSGDAGNTATVPPWRSTSQASSVAVASSSGSRRQRALQRGAPEYLRGLHGPQP